MSSWSYSQTHSSNCYHPSPPPRHHRQDPQHIHISMDKMQPVFMPITGDVETVPMANGTAMSRITSLACGKISSCCPDDGDIMQFNKANSTWEFKPLSSAGITVNPNSALSVSNGTLSLVLDPASTVTLSQSATGLKADLNCGAVEDCIVSKITNAGEVLTKDASGVLISQPASKHYTAVIDIVANTPLTVTHNLNLTAVNGRYIAHITVITDQGIQFFIQTSNFTANSLVLEGTAGASQALIYISGV